MQVFSNLDGCSRLSKVCNWYEISVGVVEDYDLDLIIDGLPLKFDEGIKNNCKLSFGLILSYELL